jgi:outer membrane protein assembly factor BamA
MAVETGTFRPPEFKRALAIAVCIALALTSTMGLLQPQPGGARPAVPIQTEGRVIDRVEFQGISSVDASYLQGVARIAPGAVWNREEIAAACARLAGTGKFEGSPYAEAREQDGKLILVFVVQERPFVTGVDIVGNVKFKTAELLKEIEISTG